MSVPRVYMVACTPPGCHGVGSLFERDLLAWYPPDRVACGLVFERSDTAPKSLRCMSWLDKAVVQVPAVPSALGGSGIRARVVRSAAWARQRRHVARHGIDVLSEHARRFGATHVLGVMDHPLVYAVCRQVASALGAQLSLLVQDAPEYLMSALGCDRWSTRRFWSDYRTTMRAASAVGVISEAMADEYGDQYQIRTVRINHGLEREMWIAPRVAPQSHDEVVIGFAGTVYAPETWGALFGALDGVHWRISGRRVRLRMIGGSMPGRIGAGGRCEVLGWLPIEQVLAALSEADILYLPYWFDESYSRAVRLCFPSKLSTYVAAGVPVLFHGPAASSPVPYVSEHRIGAACTSTDNAAIIGAIEHLLAPDVRSEVALGLRTTLETDLGAHILRERFAQLLGADVGDLRRPHKPACDCQLALSRRSECSASPFGRPTKGG